MAKARQDGSNWTIDPVRLNCRTIAKFAKNTEFYPIAWIADVVDSRSMSSTDRQEIQTRLKASIGQLNGRYRRRALAAPIALTAGDEIQALVAGSPEILVDVMRRIADAIHPDQMRFGLGRGELSTALNTRPNVAQLDGPCFHNARSALEQAAENGTWGAAIGFGELEDVVLGSMCEMIGVIRRGWTATQGAYAAEMRDERGAWRLQRDVAEAFDVRPSVVSESLKAANLQTVVRAEQALSRILDRFGLNTEGRRNSAK